MVPSKTSQCILSKSRVLMSLCAMDYHNVLCQNAWAAITQRCIVIDQIFGGGPKSDLSTRAQTDWQQALEGWQRAHSWYRKRWGTSKKSKRGRSLAVWSKESGKKETRSGTCLNGNTRPGKREQREAERRGRRRLAGCKGCTEERKRRYWERARMWP